MRLVKIKQHGVNPDNLPDSERALTVEAAAAAAEAWYGHGSSAVVEASAEAATTVEARRGHCNRYTHTHKIRALSS